MKIDFLADDGRGRTALIATPQKGDVVPAVDCLLMDAGPEIIDYDRVAVAACLLFSGGAANNVDFGWTVSQRLIEGISSSIGLLVNSGARPEEDTTAAIQATRLHVTMGLSDYSETPPTDHARLSLVPGERFYGSLHGVKESVIGSNAWLVADYVSKAYVLAAVGALYSKDFLASSVMLSDADMSEGVSDFKVIHRLYSTVGLDLETAGGH